MNKEDGRFALKPPAGIQQEWLIDQEDLLRSFHRATGEWIFKFSLHAESREFLLDVRPTKHAEMIQKYGSYGFEKYIRGIYFNRRKTVYFRGHDCEDWLNAAEAILRRSGVPTSVRVIWGPEAAHELQSDLWGL